ncbi:MAG: hypothetical protein CK548_06990 [Opitutia bacterium]|nr:hypothetical protein [Opitutaceae bacterium]PHX71324.1 MAG: hypothetical protein CK548_06990 [Opitutae bacterium]
MFTVTTVNLSADTSTADSRLGPSELGVLTPDEFRSLLDRLRRIDCAQPTEADPHLVVTSAAGHFIIRTSQGKLFLHDARDTTEPYSLLSPEEIVTQLDPQITPAPYAFPTTTPTKKPKAAPHYAIAFAIFVAGLALNAYTICSVFNIESVAQPPSVVVLTDLEELATRDRDAIGSYATGSRPGDRVITVTPDGKVRFSELGSPDGISINTDTFRLGRRDKRLCLVTLESGVVDFVNPDTLLYYGDTYRRSK